MKTTMDQIKRYMGDVPSGLSAEEAEFFSNVQTDLLSLEQAEAELALSEKLKDESLIQAELEANRADLAEGHVKIKARLMDSLKAELAAYKAFAEDVIRGNYDDSYDVLIAELERIGK